MLASDGYPWTTIKVDNRDTYMVALESASVDNDIRTFAQFIVGAVLEDKTKNDTLPKDWIQRHLVPFPP